MINIGNRSFYVKKNKNMKQKILFGILFLFLSGTTIFAQQPTNSTAFKIIKCNLPVDSVFDYTIDYLQDNGYFIVSLERLSGFIQAKIHIKNNKLMSAKAGERRTLNFIIRPVSEKQSSITLNIYSEELTFSNDASNRVYYYEDKGISNDRTIYKPILDGLQVFFDNKH